MASNSAFVLDIGAFVKKAKGNQRAVVKKIFLDLGTAIVERTPVGDPDEWKMPAPKGYIGGRARGSWQYGYNAPVETEPGTIDGRDPDRQNMGAHSATARLAVGVDAQDALGVHYVTSTVPYMRRLEYEAWSKQAPEGMVRITVVEFQAFVDNAVREANE